MDKAKIDDSSLRKSPHLEFIADTGSKSIFQTKVDETFGKNVPRVRTGVISGKYSL